MVFPQAFANTDVLCSVIHALEACPPCDCQVRLNTLPLPNVIDKAGQTGTILEEEALHRRGTVLLRVRNELFVRCHVILRVAEAVADNHWPDIDFRDPKGLLALLRSLVICFLAACCHRCGCQRLVAQDDGCWVATSCGPKDRGGAK